MTEPEPDQPDQPDRPDPRDHYLDVPHGRLRYRDEGDGPPVVLLHAGIAQLESWDAVADALTSAGLRVIRPDLRGWGRSTTEDLGFSPRADVIAVLDAAGVGRAVLVGNSMGGSLAFDTALEYPERVVGVVGVGAGLSGYDGVDTPEELKIFAEMERLESAGPPDPDAIAELDVSAWVDGPGQPAGRAPQWVRDAVRTWDRAINQPRHVMGRRQQLDPPAAQRLEHLGCPVFAVAGTLDFSYVVDTARHLERNAPNARAVVWDDVAHMIGMEQPDRLADLVVAFAGQLYDER
ncbi:MAG: alpha/beta fold hydrolase [Actinomycetales bacterium]